MSVKTPDVPDGSEDPQQIIADVIYRPTVGDVISRRQNLIVGLKAHKEQLGRLGIIVKEGEQRGELSVERYGKENQAFTPIVAEDGSISYQQGEAQVIYRDYFDEEGFLTRSEVKRKDRATSTSQIWRYTKPDGNGQRTLVGTVVYIDNGDYPFLAWGQQVTTQGIETIRYPQAESGMLDKITAGPNPLEKQDFTKELDELLNNPSVDLQHFAHVEFQGEKKVILTTQQILSIPNGDRYLSMQTGVYEMDAAKRWHLTSIIRYHSEETPEANPSYADQIDFSYNNDGTLAAEKDYLPGKNERGEDIYAYWHTRVYQPRTDLPIGVYNVNIDYADGRSQEFDFVKKVFLTTGNTGKRSVFGVRVTDFVRNEEGNLIPFKIPIQNGMSEKINPALNERSIAYIVRRVTLPKRKYESTNGAVLEAELALDERHEIIQSQIPKITLFAEEG